MDSRDSTQDKLVPIRAQNPGIELDHGLIAEIQANPTAIIHRTNTLKNRRSVKSHWQTAWLLKAITLMDLTTLAGDDTPGRVTRLATKAQSPVSMEILQKLKVEKYNLKVGAVCVYHEMIAPALDALNGSSIPIAAVSTGFPAGLTPFDLRLAEIRESVSLGAQEIDVVISRRHVLTENWEELYDEIKLFKEACNTAKLKVILATGELVTMRNIGKASMVAMMAGADFIKTSTGKEPVNATLPVSLVMIRAIRSYFELTGNRVGFKPAGGISKAKESLQYLMLIKEELGTQWLSPGLFRFGASSLLNDIERQLEHRATGRYSASYRHPQG
ncbi:MAG: deoxyribose-phosphate aldolase [Rhodobacteraceae bacterium]|nr:deoxyribose-phosphate aldolase [Paracoccaceae bacterium]